MERGFHKLRGYQQTIPNMMRIRDEQSQSFLSPVRIMESVMENTGMVCQTQNIHSSTRINPYRIPFQRRQPVEPVYADTAPLIIPQAAQLPSVFEFGDIYGGANGIFMPNVQRNMIESPTFVQPNNTRIIEDPDICTKGLTSSPPSHSIPQKMIYQLQKPESSFLRNSDLDVTATGLRTLDSKKMTSQLQKSETSSEKNKGDMNIEAAGESKQLMNFEPSNTSMRVLTGSVEKIIKWEKMWDNKKDKPSILFEVIAPLLQINEGIRAIEHQLLLRETGGPVLTIMYYEIDQLVPKLTRGQYVRCVCRSLGKRRFQAFSVRPASQQEHSSLQRLSFLCQRAVQEALLAVPAL